LTEKADRGSQERSENRTGKPKKIENLTTVKSTKRAIDGGEETVEGADPMVEF